MKKWKSNDIENDFSTTTYKEGTLIKSKTSGEIAFKSKKDDDIFYLEKIEIKQFFIDHYMPLLLVSAGFAVLTAVFTPYWVLFIIISEVIIYKSIKNCKKKTKQRLINSFKIIFILEIAFILLYAIFMFATPIKSTLFSLPDVITGFTLFNFYLFTRLYLATRQIIFGKDIYRLKEHDGFYLWRAEQCI